MVDYSRGIATLIIGYPDRQRMGEREHCYAGYMAVAAVFGMVSLVIFLGIFLGIVIETGITR